MSFNPATNDRQLAIRLKKLRNEAAQERSTALLQSTLDLAASESKEMHDSYAQQTLHLFIRNNKADDLLPLIAYLLQTTNATLDSTLQYISYQCASIPLLELLCENGFDINQPDKANNDQRILDMLITNESYVEWLLEHGAQTNFTEPQPILDVCARLGSLATFRLLQSRGATLSSRTLHCAAKAAASYGASPTETQAGDESKQSRGRMEVLRHLVEELEMDVNVLDDDGDNPIDHFGYWGTPLAYAASEPRGAGVVRWLLEHGADSGKGKGEGIYNACWVAEFQGNRKILDVLEKSKKIETTHTIT
ncbi:hypothetical protein E8E13_008184 [Curvularia kusanoi]|uniref:Ankyrin n=1 Tax=Curvularia kusanoi TaxID=90978 RepID=A0A9P4TAL6_CURKU|nr:hypothetical protein E8E13_008184 [Curvularia kusanoi]